ncbi:S8 family serine peptidase [Clostridium botulinum]|nr:S8 family serine peptidase [Clostridium botulinum]
MIHIAIIDDGVNENCYNIGKLEYNIEIDSQLKIKKRINYDSYSNSHGSICSAIIKKYFDNCIISSIKILSSDSKMASAAQLVKAVEYCVNNNLQLINLSLGTVDQYYYDNLKRIINYAYKNNVILVGANDNNDKITYPASLSNVIGVRSDRSGKLKENEYNYYIYPYDGIDILAFSKHSLKKYSGEILKLNPANSFAGPYITAKVAEIIERYNTISLGKIRKILLENSQNYQFKSSRYMNYNPCIYSTTDWINTVLAFSLSKTELLFSTTMYDFRIIKYIKIKCESLCLGLTSIINYMRKNDDIISNIDSIIVFIDNNVVIDLKDERELEFICSLKKNIIFVTENKKIYKYFYLFNLEFLKLWNPYADIIFLKDKKKWDCYLLQFIKRKLVNYYNYIYNNTLTKFNNDKSVENTISICIFDLTKEKYLNICYKIKQLFIKDGYNAIAVVDTLLGKLYGMEFIPGIGNSSDNTSTLLNKLDKIVNIHKDYVLIYGMSTSEQKINIRTNIINLVETDMYILVVDRYSKNVCKFINSKKNNVIILITTVKDANYYKLKFRDIKIIYLYDENIILKIYNYILSLYS